MKWFRFHLSTMVAVTLVFGALLGLNLRPEQKTGLIDNYKNYPQLVWTFPSGTKIVQESYGWPAATFVSTHAVSYGYDFWHEDEFLPNAISTNAIVAILACAGIVGLLEKSSAVFRFTKKSAAQSPAPEMQSRI